MSANLAQLALPVLVDDAPLPDDGSSDEPVSVDPVAFLEATLGRPLYAYERRYLTGPIVVDRLGAAWELPRWLPEAIAKGRVAQILVEAEAGTREYDRMASLPEVVAVLMTASLAYPLNREAATAYLWAAAQVVPMHCTVRSSTVYGLAESPKSVLERIYGPDGWQAYVELDPYLEREVLDRLRRDIRRKVVGGQKER
jgi:hypothetical protein